jgi:pimeloyl-ACP methyl ester carboxylesterase
VVAVDLSGHGARLELKPLDEIRLSDYVEDVVGEIEERDLQDVVLVGHSLAGITLPLVATRLAHRLRKLVYLSTSNPKVGESINDLMKHPLSPLSRGADFEAMFCNDLDEEASSWLISRLGPEPPGPMAEQVTLALSPPEVESVYVLLEKDETLPPAFQREQARNAGIQKIVSLDAGHSAFASQPRALAELLLSESAKTLLPADDPDRAQLNRRA